MVWTNFWLILRGFLVLCSLLYNKLENKFLLTPSHVPVSRFALRSYVLARTRITIYEINWDHKLAPTTSSFFLGGEAVYLIFYYFMLPRHFSLRKLFEKEKTILFFFSKHKNTKYQTNLSLPPAVSRKKLRCSIYRMDSLIIKRYWAGLLLVT